MSNASLLLTIAGVSMSFAGFASHDAARRRYEVGPVYAIVLFGE